MPCTLPAVAPVVSVSRKSPVTRARKRAPRTSPSVVSESRPEMRTTSKYLWRRARAKYPEEG